MFGVRVPRVAQARRSSGTGADSYCTADTASLREFKVLVVDDGRTILDAMHALLERWASFIRSTARRTLRLINSEIIDAVLADHLGDGSTGLELIKRIIEIRGPVRGRVDHRGSRSGVDARGPPGGAPTA